MDTKAFLPDGLKRLHDAMARHVETGVVPGAVTLVSRGDEVHADALGQVSFGAGARPMARDALFRISSMTKPVTAVAAMMLVEQGRLRLDEPVSRLLPELAHPRVLERPDGALEATVPAKRPITVEDLLTFRMGFGILWGPQDALPIQKAANALHLGAFGPPKPEGVPAPDEWIRRFATLPLIRQPGECWLYNTGAEVLSVLVARASGLPLDSLLRERIFEPLGMKDTSFSVAPEKRSRFTTSYIALRKTGALDLYDEIDGQWAKPPAFPSGAAGLVSTADDFAAFGRMLLNGGALGGVRLLSEASVKAMTSDQLTAEQKAAAKEFPRGWWRNHGWGYGMAVVTGPDEYGSGSGRFGWDGGLGTSWGSDPSKDLVAVLMTQRSEFPAFSPVYRDFWTGVYRAIA